MGKNTEQEPLLRNFSQESKFESSGTILKSKNFNSKSTKKHKGSWLQWRRRKEELKMYYEYQERLMSLYEEDEKLLNRRCISTNCRSRSDEYNEKRRIDGILAVLSLILNMFLLVINATTSYLSGSLSILSTFVDSAIDCTSGALIFIGAWSIKHTDHFNYPRGRARLELVVSLICSIIMGVVNFMLIFQSIQSIVSGNVHPRINFILICILLGSGLLKVVLMIICFKHGTKGSQIIALDMKNDLITAFIALFSAFLGTNYWSFADPIGAICVCAFVAISWFNNAISNIPMMVGKRALQENLSRIIRICIEHDSHIKCLDHVMVYHTGEKAIVEVHIVLDEHLQLKVTHDIIESLTMKISTLPFVERTFVHGDYRCDGDWYE